MFITMRGVIALRQFRMELQENAGDEFPEDVLTELLVLHDICKYLGLNIFQAKEVLGEKGWHCVMVFINAPACDSMNFGRIAQLRKNKGR